MSSVARQFHFLGRKLGRSPMFTLVSVLTLALGIGATSAIFSVVHGVLLKPLPFDEPDELVGVWHEAPGLGFDLLNQSPAFHFTYRDESQVFDDVGTGSRSSRPRSKTMTRCPSLTSRSFERSRRSRASAR